MNTTQLTVGKEYICIKNCIVRPFKQGSFYKFAEYQAQLYWFYNQGGGKHAFTVSEVLTYFGIDVSNQYFTTTPPDQKIKQQALAQCDEALKLNSQIGNFGKPNDKDNKPDQEGCSSGLLNGFNDGLHRSSGIGGQSPELSTLDQEGKREESEMIKFLKSEIVENPEQFKKDWKAVCEKYPTGVGAIEYLESLDPLHKELAKSAPQLLSRNIDLTIEVAHLQSRVKELEGLNEAAEKHIEIITRERDWQTDVVVPDLEQQIAALKQENERLKGGDFKSTIKNRIKHFEGIHHTYEASELKQALSSIQRLIPPIMFSIDPPTAPTTDAQTDK